MNLTEDQRALLRRLRGQNSRRFVALAAVAELDPAQDFIGADLRGIDFQTDDLKGFVFHRAQVQGANLARAKNVTPEMLKDAIPDASTRGFVVRDFPGGPEMVRVPGGTFAMGVRGAENEREGTDDAGARPVHDVAVPRFLIGRHPVTRGQYAAFVRATGHDSDDDWSKPGFRQNDRHPVVNVSHDDARAYAAWASERSGKSYRLPSEAEWEYACRAGTPWARYWGDSWDPGPEAVRSDDPDGRGALGAHYAHADSDTGTVPVGGRLPNGFGLYDTLGNVWEWCADEWHDDYNGAPADGSAWTTTGSGVRRVLRGGSWYSGPGNVRAGFRDVIDVRSRVNGAGFRLARTSF